MIHVTLCYAKVTTGLYQEEEDVMVTGSIIDSYGLQDLEQPRVGKSQRKKRVEYGN